MSEARSRRPPRRADVIAVLRERQEDLRQFGIRSLALFGSAARDEAGPQSDLDFLVEFVGPATFDDYMGLKILLEDLLATRVDLVMRTALKSDRLIAAVERDAVRVA